MATNDPASDFDRKALVKRLRALKRACGRNKHDQAITLITAGIEAGLQTRKLIVEALKDVGLNADHVAIILNEGTGEAPLQYHWRRDADGHYHVHDETTQP